MSSYKSAKNERLRREEQIRIQEQIKERDIRRKQLGLEKEKLNNELNNLHGLFSGKRRREIEIRLAAIKRELQ